MHLSSDNIEFTAKQSENLSSTAPPQEPFLVSYEHGPSNSTTAYLQNPSDLQSSQSTSLNTRNETNKSSLPHEMFHLNIATEPTRESKEFIRYQV